MASRASRTVSSPPTRTTILLIAIATACWHLEMVHICSLASASLSRQIEDDDEIDGAGKLEAIRLVVGGGLYLLSLSSFAIACVGIIAVFKERPHLIRVFAMSNFLSLGGELLLLALASLLCFTNMSSTSFSASLCEAIAHSDIGSMDLLGWSLESCEERWKALATGVTGLVACIALIRVWAALQVLNYFAALVKRLRRKQPLSISTHSHIEHYSDAGQSRDLPSPSSSGKHSAGHRIFLLPGPLSGIGNVDGGIPMVSVTPSSPLDAFPPSLPVPGSVSFPPVPATSVPSADQPPQYLVYAPVMMSAEQARQLNANEIVYSSRPRSSSSRSHSSRSVSSILIHEPLHSPEADEPNGGKGKVA